MTLQQLVDYLTIKPCETFNLEYGTLKENGYADLTIIDLDSEQEIKGEDFLSKQIIHHLSAIKFMEIRS